MTRKVVQLSSDPFARTTTVRKVIQTWNTCDWCGQNHKGHLFRYGSDNDWRTGWDNRVFCSIGCRRDYYA